MAWVCLAAPALFAHVVLCSKPSVEVPLSAAREPAPPAASRGTRCPPASLGASDSVVKAVGTPPSSLPSPAPSPHMVQTSDTAQDSEAWGTNGHSLSKPSFQWSMGAKWCYFRFLTFAGCVFLAVHGTHAHAEGQEDSSGGCAAVVVSLLPGSHLEGRTSRWNPTGEALPFPTSLFSGCRTVVLQLPLLPVCREACGALAVRAVPAWYPRTKTEFIADICLAQIPGQVLFLASHSCFLI